MSPMTFRWTPHRFPTAPMPLRQVSARGFTLVLGLAVLAPSSHSQDAPRWSEAGYGVSLTPPPNTAQVENGAVSWIDARGFSISFEIVGSDLPVGLEDMTANALVQMGFAQATPRMLDADGQPADQRPIPERIADRPAVRMYFSLDQQDKPDWFYEMSNLVKDEQPSFFYGQAIVMLEPHAAVVIKLVTVEDARQPGQEAFEAVVDSLDIPLASELDARREERVERADQWLSTTLPEDWAKVLPRDQWYRLIFRDQDLGHVRVRSTRDPADLRRFDQEPPGTLMVIDRREYVDDHVLDSRSVLFLHDDNQRELWETKTTLRPGVAPQAKPAGLNAERGGQAVTWVQIGIRGSQQVRRRDLDGNPLERNLNVITVITETPPTTAALNQIAAHERFTGRSNAANVRGKIAPNQEFVAPDRSYLSQLQVWALGAMLPATRETYCFSAYHPDSGQPGLRTVEVVPQDDGGVVVLDRPTSRLSPTRSVYDADRNLVERVTPQGVRLVPTTPEELAGVWGVALDSR